MFLKVKGSLDIPIGYAQLVTADLLQVRRLCLDEEFVEGRDLDLIDQTQVHTHPNFAQIVHRLFGADLLSSAQNPERSADVVVKVLFVFVQQEIASASFVLDQSWDDFADLFHEKLLRASQSGLVTDLVEVTHELRTFAEETPHSDVDLVQCAKDFVDLFRSDQGG